MWAFVWLDGPDWGREAERIGQVVSRSPLMSTALDILSIIVHTLCATIVVSRGVFSIIRDRQDSLAPFRPSGRRSRGGCSLPARVLPASWASCNMVVALVPSTSGAIICEALLTGWQQFEYRAGIVASSMFP